MPWTGRAAVRSEKAQRTVAGPAHAVVVEQEAADAAVPGQNAGLRLDLLRSEHAPGRGEQGIPVEQLQVAGQLLPSVDLAAALHLDRDADAVRVTAHQVDRPDRRRELAAHQPPAVAQKTKLSGAQCLQMRLDTVLAQAGISSHLDRGVAEDLLDVNSQGLARLAGRDPATRCLGQLA